MVAPKQGTIIEWNAVGVTVPEGQIPTAAAELGLTEDVARAIYEALAEHFGLVGSTALLKAHNEALDLERGRVDKLIDHLIG